VRRHRRAALGATIVAVAALALPAAGHANSTQESTFMDDAGLVFGDDQRVEATFQTLRALGVDRVRVSLLWSLVAPAAKSTSRPSFGAGGAKDPAGYPAGAWDRYDRIVNAAQRNGIQVLFCLTGPGPLWASSNPGAAQPMLDPHAGDFGDFVTAVGRRYSGTYADEHPVTPPPPGGILAFLFPRPTPPPPPPPVVLPRVTMWSLWNEPNQPGWLRPQTGARNVPASPRVFRGLADSAYAGLVNSGHSGDSILLAETAPRGSSRTTNVSPMRPLLFIRELYCLDKRLRPFTGNAAAVRGCPTNAAGRRAFSQAHPVLFRATGWAHHPYGLEVAPHVKDRNTDQVTISVIGRLTKTLDRIQQRYGSSKRFPIWLTEYGYQTRPPDPLIGVSWATQANYINQADYIAYRYARVRSVSQFLLVDDGPNRDVGPSNIRYWGSTFQTGLITGEGQRRAGVKKPAFAAYQRPIFVTARSVRRGARVTVFGQLRPAANGARLSATLEFRAGRSGAFRAVRSVTTRNRANYAVIRRVKLTRSGSLRLAWRGAVGVQRSRALAVRVRR
jgi:hypothetical protein